MLAEIRNQEIQGYFESLTPTESTEYSLWIATNIPKKPQQHNPVIKNNNNI